MSFKGRVLSQNFIINGQLVKKLVRLTQLSRKDTVIDIGAGAGILTEELASVTQKVIAVEVDGALACELKKRFYGKSNITVCNEDIRTFSLPNAPYSVFANIPFHITSDVIYKLLYYSRPPENAYLIMQREAAEKFSGSPKSTQFSVLAAPWFEFRILYRFLRSDFYPPPGVDVVLLQISRRKQPWVSESERLLYRNFVSHLFGKWERNLKASTRDIFTYTQWKRLALAHGFNVKSSPSELRAEQWLGIFNFFKTLDGEL